MGTQACGDDGNSVSACACTPGGGSGSPGSGGVAPTGGAPPASGGVRPNEGGAGGLQPGSGGSTDVGGAGGSGGQGLGGGAGAAGAAAGGSGGQMLPPVSDYSALGPFTTTSAPNQGPGGGYTIFRPEPLGEGGFLHPPLIWGPGIATQVSSYTQLLTLIASHGFVVLAVNTLSAGPGSPANEQAMTDGLDWIIQQNGEAGIFQSRLDVTRAVSMGYSIGGTAAVQVGAHPSVMTTVSIHGHSATSALHGPLLQTTGTEDTIGLPLQQQTFDASQVQTFLATLTGATHFEILSSGGGREAAPIVAWLRFWVYGDEGARGFFYGDDCALCVSPWENPQRKNWQ